MNTQENAKPWRCPTCQAHTDLLVAVKRAAQAHRSAMRRMGAYDPLDRSPECHAAARLVGETGVALDLALERYANGGAA